MHTKHSIMEQIDRLGIKKTDTLLIHSSMKAIGQVENGGETVIDAFIEYLSQGLLIFPTHTWKQINEEYSVFNPLTEPSCVGLLTNLFLKRPNVYRSLHPTHSVAAIGRDALNHVSGEENWDTPCPRYGCWGKLYDRNAKILFLGCSLKRNTILHGVEEWNNIPNRMKDEYQMLKIITPDKIIERPMRRHYNAAGDISEYYGKIKDALLYTGLAHEGKIGDADSVLCDAKGMVDLVTSFLHHNPDLFQDDSPVPKEWYS